MGWISEPTQDRSFRGHPRRRRAISWAFLAVLLFLADVPAKGWADEDTLAWAVKGPRDFVKLVEGANQYGPENPEYTEVLLDAISSCSSSGEIITAAVIATYGSLVFEDMATSSDGADREAYREKASIFRGFSLRALRVSDSRELLERSLGLLEVAYQGSPTRLQNMPPGLRGRLQGAALQAPSPTPRSP